MATNSKLFDYLEFFAIIQILYAYYTRNILIFFFNLIQLSNLILNRLLFKVVLQQYLNT